MVEVGSLLDSLFWWGDGVRGDVDYKFLCEGIF